MSRVLLVEDEDDIALALGIILRARGHETTHVGEGRAAIAEVLASPPELVLLDIGLPDVDGWTVLDSIRERSSVPVLLLTAAGSDDDKVRGLLGGADDFLTKPFSAAVLAARVARLLHLADASGELSWGDVVLPPTRQSATVAGAPVVLAPLERRVLTAFLRRPGEALDAEALLLDLWGDDSVTAVEHVAAAVERMRAALGWDSPDGPLRPLGDGAWHLGPPG